jgi:tetratricopeptide (TPR) repeat protein/energy-coupling factor transporter ATP-binding protein EcfA2
MTQPTPLFNPFPGLRPFEPDEDHLFFGREKETDDLLRRLRSHRFLTVIGTSGCGKSSLVRCGLIPSLQSGYMVKAGSSWRVAVLRPGEDPIGHLADALNHPDAIGGLEDDLATTNRVLLEATLRRGTLGLVDAVRQARIPANDNILVLVDQFEELFRFRRSRQIENSRDEAVTFVKLLLEASKQNAIPIYVVLTMRSDFIGDCMEYPGLPEALNESQYLVPRMTRDELRFAITGPVAVAGADIAPRLVLRLLNDTGDDQDDLPLLQHGLMRVFDQWKNHRQPGRPIDLLDYEAVGTLRNALSRHADEAYQEARSVGERAIERVFKALTDTFSDPRGVRRPTAVSELAAICELSESDVIRIVEIFRRAGRSFLMPPPQVPLTSHVIVDLSHESLMRCWTRLIGWAREERAAAALYVRLSREASFYAEGAAGLWGDPELELGLRWRRENRPTAAWARRYDEDFDRAIQFLDRSERERERAKAERHAQRVRKFQLAWGTAGVLLVMLMLAVWQATIARREGSRAEANLRLARGAVDELLVSTERNQASVGADVPQMEQLRRELLERAKPFYAEFIKQEPDNEEFLKEMGAAHFRLGHINRMVDDPEGAAGEYRESIRLFDNLAKGNPGRTEYRQALANAYNYLGETLRPSSQMYADAAQAYGSALRLQEALTREAPADDVYKQELGRTHYNRGILYASNPAPNDDTSGQADSDFREAIRLLEPLSQKGTNPQASQELARAYNNLAALLAQGARNEKTLEEARPFYERAIRIHEALTKSEPRNREYKFELAKFSDNYAELLRELADFGRAREYSSRALTLLDGLVRPAPSLGIEQADAHNLRGRILQSEGSPDAVTEYRAALKLFEDLASTEDVTRLEAFHLRFGDLLQNLASLSREAKNRQSDDGRRVLLEAVGYYVDLGRALGSATPDQAKLVLDNLMSLMPQLTDADRARVLPAVSALQRDLGERATTGK